MNIRAYGSSLEMSDEPYFVRSVFDSPISEAMAFKELLILVAIAIEDVDIDITMDTTHLTIRT